jgi:hypothetical protein
MGSFGPTQGDEKRFLFSNFSLWKRRPTLCHLDRSVPGFPTSRCWRRPRVRFSLRKPHDVDQRHGSRQEIRGSAVERSAVSLLFTYAPDWKAGTWLCISYGVISALCSSFPHYRLTISPVWLSMCDLALGFAKKKIVEVSAKFTRLHWNKF